MSVNDAYLDFLGSWKLAMTYKSAEFRIRKSSVYFEVLFCDLF